MPSMLCLGECMVELADAGDGLYRRGFAGDTFNTAWYARRLLPADWTVAYGTCIGTDAVSGEMADFMAREGIDTRALRPVDGRSVGLYMISLSRGERSFSYWRSQSAARLLADDADWLSDTLRDRDTIYFSGITLAILTPEARARLCDALANAGEAGSRVAFDTNQRPRLWESAAAMRDGMLAGAGVSDIVLPSLDEERDLFGDETAQHTAERYHGCGAQVVAVKSGGDALWLSDAGGTRQLSALPVAQVVDTTAAGDSFGGAFVSGLAMGQPTEAAAQAAMALAARVIQHRGALVPALFEGETS